jgi:environmental stress-induced protein Ves
MVANMTRVRGADLVALPWKNGGGLTSEIAVSPVGAAFDTFVWRVSIAEVAAAGAFSTFAGVDRTLVLLAGAGMMLDQVGGATLSLERPLDIARFAGETAINAGLVDGATRDFNLMVRRGKAAGELAVVRGGAASTCTLDADVVLLFCASKSVGVTLGNDDPIELAVNDTLIIDAPDALRCAFDGDGDALVISIRHVHGA